MELPINYTDSHWAVREQARLQYVAEQKGLCWHCKTKLTDNPSKAVLAYPISKALFPQGMFDYPVHLHHDRSTGLTIGAVHSQCNAYLWQYKHE